MKTKYFLILVFIVLIASCTPTPMYAQWLVTDPSSITQRLTLFMEELAEAMEERYSIEKQTDNTSKLVEQNKESLKKLQKISNFIKSALVVKEIAEESNIVIKKVKSINDNYSKLDRLTKEEVYNALSFSADLGEQVYNKVNESKKTSSSTITKSGEMTDYERLEILYEIKDEIVKIKKSLTSVESRFKSKNSYEVFSKQARSYTREALFMAFESQNDTKGIKKEGKTPKKKSEKSTKKSTK